MRNNTVSKRIVLERYTFVEGTLFQTVPLRVEKCSTPLYFSGWDIRLRWICDALVT